MSDVALRESVISDYVDDYRELELSYDSMYLLEAEEISNSKDGSEFIVLTGDSLVSRYQSDLEDLIITKTLNAEEQSKYFFNPWKLSYDLYGSVEYWHLLLELNSMYSINEFNQETIKVYSGSLPSYVERILSVEEDFIAENNATLEATLSGTTDDYTASTEKLDNDVDYIEVI